MPNSNQLVEQTNDEISRHNRNVLDDLIREQVIHAMGSPEDLLEVQVRKVWDNHFRVNVLVGPNLGAVRLVNSYFVETDSKGGVIKTSPSIVKLYPATALEISK